MKKDTDQYNVWNLCQIGSNRSSHWRCFVKKIVLKNIKNFTGKHLCWRFILGRQLYLKKTPTQVFFCEICEIFKNDYFEENLQTTASIQKFPSLFPPLSAKYRYSRSTDSVVNFEQKTCQKPITEAHVGPCQTTLNVNYFHKNVW